MRTSNARKSFAWVAFVATLSGFLSAISFTSTPAVAATVNCASTMATQSSLKVTPSHGAVFYIDSSVTPKVDSAYVAYKIDNTSGTAQNNVWVQLSAFAGGKVTLANQADANQQISIPANGTATAFFLLKASGASTVAQSHTVQIFDKRPDLENPTSLLGCNFAFKKVAETIKASANKIDSVTGALSPSTATLGGTYTITVKGATGKIGSGSLPDLKAIWSSPSAYSSWPTRSLRLVNTQLQFCTGAQYNSTPAATLTNQLLYNPANFPNCLGNNGDTWIGTYTFRIIGPGPSSLTPSPVAIISSGTQYKHSDVNGIASNTSVNLSGVANTDVAVNVTASSSVVASTAGSVTIRYTAAISTTSTTPLTVDELVDTHDNGSEFVSGSVKTGTSLASLSSAPDPSVVAADVGSTPPPYHFIGPYSTVSGTPYYVQYDFVIPCDTDAATYSAKVVAYTGDVMIGSGATSISTSNVTTSKSVGCASPTIANVNTSMSPSAVTNPAGNIAATTATLNGFAYPVGQTGVEYQFTYSTDPNLVNGAISTELTSATGSSGVTASANITSLTPGTIYYFRTAVRDSSGTYYYGDILSFQTLPAQAVPTVITGSVSGLTGGSATLNGTTNPNLNAVSNVFFRLCTNSGLTTGCITNVSVQVDDGSGAATNLTFTAASSGDFAVSTDGITGTQRVTSLTLGTTYFYRLSISCTVNATYCPTGQVDGAVRSFTYGAPTTLTSDATLIGSTSATLNGLVNANSTTANASLCYADTNVVTNGVLGSAVCLTATPSSVTGSVDTEIATSVTGLTPGTTYYFQAKSVVISPSYTSYGSVLSFVTLGQTTPSLLPSGETGSPYQASLSGVGGSNSYSWSTTSTLPAGLTLSPTGLISGTPSAGGVYEIVVRMTDIATGLYVDKTYTLVIGATVTFHSNFVGGEADVYQVSSEAAPLRGNTFSRTGYDFVGWSSSPSGTLDYLNQDQYLFENSTDLYALWEATNYSITFDKNDDSGVTTSADYSYGATDALDYDAGWTRPGYTFLGWSTSPSAKTPLLNYTVTGASTLFAVWEVETYTITFDKNDGSASTTSADYAYGATDALSFSNPWTRTGFTFSGWSADPNATEGDLSYTVTGPATLYAIWVEVPANSAVITYDKNDGSGSYSQLGLELGNTTALTKPNPWSRSGYTFLGWSTDPAALAPDTTYTVTGDATLYAVWEITAFTITYDANDLSGNQVEGPFVFGATDALEYNNPWSRPGYTFLGWSTSAAASVADLSYTVSGDDTLYAVWEENSYTLTYLSNDGKSETVTHEYGYLAKDALSFTNPWVRPGFNFLGWSTNPSAKSPDSTYSVTSNDSLYAVWEAIQYSITYESNDGLNNQIVNSMAHEDSTALTFISGWSRVGFTFLGWSTTPDASTPLESYVVEGNDSLYAVWEITIYTITFDRNPGASLDNQYNYGATNALSFAPGWTLAGFTFLGWSTDANAKTAATSFTVTGDETLFAIWQVAPAATFGKFPDLVKNLAIGKFTLVNPTTNSPGMITYKASCAGIVKIVGKVVTLVSAGNCVITATVAAAPNFGRASVSMNLRITPKVVTLKQFKLNRSVFFKGDSSVLTPTANAILSEIFNILRGKKNIVVSVKGWVKETPDKSYDISLSNRRAGNIVNSLRNLFGIKGQYVHKGYGISPENNYTSRRADIEITYTN